MAQNPLPAGFPLAPVDASGSALTVGMRVKVLTVASCASGLPSEDQAKLRGCEGKYLVISEIDRYGFVWFAGPGEFNSFCLRPEEMELATPGAT
jgi:hypothetical protein